MESSVKNQYNYCTLFNLKYLSRGLTLYNSLLQVKIDFHLYILAMDDETYKVLKKLNLKKITCISLQDFEYDELLKIKPTRTMQEYCWTCTPSIIQYCLQKFHLRQCTYLDADIYFFSSPKVLHDELKNKDVLITEHNYYPDYDQTTTSGRFCVQFVTFNNNAKGLEVLSWWRNACLTWCHAYYEDGKFGDQKYLDDWPERFPQVKIIQNQGAGLAPWNLANFDLFIEKNQLKISNIKTEKIFPVIFYHFHDLKFNEQGQWFHASGYPGYHIGVDAYKYIYTKYLVELFQLKLGDLKDLKTDFPGLPNEISKVEFENQILPAIDALKNKLVFRKAFSLIDEKYQLIQNLTTNILLVVFKILLSSNYKLNRYAMWNYPGSYFYEFKGDYVQQFSSKALLHSILMKSKLGRIIIKIIRRLVR